MKKKPIKKRMQLTLSASASGPVKIGIPVWQIEPSRHHKLRVAPDGMSAILEFEVGHSVPPISVIADAEIDLSSQVTRKRVRKKLKLK